MSEFTQLLSAIDEFVKELEAMPNDQRVWPAWVASQLRQRMANYKNMGSAAKLAKDYVDWFNSTYGRKFQSHHGLVRLCNALTARWYELSDLQLVTRYLYEEWGKDEKMSKWFVPTSLLTAAKFQERLDLAKERFAPKSASVHDTIKTYRPPKVVDTVSMGEIRDVVQTLVGKLKRRSDE